MFALVLTTTGRYYSVIVHSQAVISTCKLLDHWKTKEPHQIRADFGFSKSDFYKTFTRPIAKVLLLAVFTYQVAYYGWRKAESSEIHDVKSGTSSVFASLLALPSPRVLTYGS